MNNLLELLRQNARRSLEELAAELSTTPEEVAAQISALEKDGVIRGYQTMVDPAQLSSRAVTAFIEVRLTPERGGGFDRLARRIARFEQVKSCYLTSGGFDLLVLVEGEDLMGVANFVAEQLSPLEGVVSCATIFRLKSYKENGFFFGAEENPERLPVSP
ncbi:Lrp/AsnC family transcriptional regulator [Akkermansiaceae bacterium]|nr:Lrp/AsnC family transcriptional regulator [Akkermansiaceae bacterium]MDB4286455.1 Lrp/AsnC family transcriptional regulator [bacterium]MDA7519227.1 Lrp/AsnC family transcriptional regulator [Akkermansiaceae bacterium]MDA7649068.1 Lrp/AsnC family transcriptional regulator [Akkermansiaceae bacterium]MDA7862905.1 Lrp/AsnC family transcriptional regulator [Akkermansiaceae bacterium]